MTFLLLLPTVLALLTLGAHYARYGLYPLTLFLLLMIGLLFVKRRWAARTLQVILCIAAFEWGGVLYDVARERAMEGRDARRSGIILGGTGLFTLLAAGLYQTPRLRRRYPAKADRNATEVGAP
ncbi:MAG: hypothetical protein IT354_13825 [Gemmatimonadaceae bacterium]|nr:hypothetical protein [Gemmatimonadaceae bacterium]